MESESQGQKEIKTRLTTKLVGFAKRKREDDLCGKNFQMLHLDLEYFIAPEHANEGNRVNDMKSSASHRAPPMVHISLGLAASRFVWPCRRVLWQVVEIVEAFQDILEKVSTIHEK